MDYTQDDDLVSITGGPLRPHEYVLVVQELTAADEAWIQNHAAKMSKGKLENMKDVEITFTIGDMQLATLKRVVRGWNLTRTRKRADGTAEEVPFPFSIANVERLPLSIYKYVLKKYSEMHPEEEEGEDDEAFLPVVVDSSEESLHTERVARLKR